MGGKSAAKSESAKDNLKGDKAEQQALEFNFDAYKYDVIDFKVQTEGGGMAKKLELEFPLPFVGGEQLAPSEGKQGIMHGNNSGSNEVSIDNSSKGARRGSDPLDKFGRQSELIKIPINMEPLTKEIQPFSIKTTFPVLKGANGDMDVSVASTKSIDSL
jgi:hypothetical protein